MCLLRIVVTIKFWENKVHMKATKKATTMILKKVAKVILVR